jgi:hypothetical protein
METLARSPARSTAAPRVSARAALAVLEQGADQETHALREAAKRNLMVERLEDRRAPFAARRAFYGWARSNTCRRR